MKKEIKEPIKIILLGDSGVGKTNIILRYLKNEFNSNSLSTIGTTFGVKQLTRNNIIYNLNIWDTTGQEAYRAVTKLFVQGAQIVILVYSIDKPNSLESINFWYNSVKEICGDNIVLAIVGNKYDLLFDDKIVLKEIVPDEEGQKIAKEKNAIFKLISAKNDKKGIDSLFEKTLDDYLDRNIFIEQKDESIKINNKSHKKEKKKKCC